MSRAATPTTLAVTVAVLMTVVLTAAMLADDYGLIESLAWSLGVGILTAAAIYRTERRKPTAAVQTVGRWLAGLLVLLVATIAVSFGLRALGVDSTVATVVAIVVMASALPESYFRRYVLKR